MSFTSFTPNQTYPNFETLTYPTVTVSTLSTAGAVTYTAAQILGGLVLRDPNGSARTDIMPTFTLLSQAINGCTVGRSFQFDLRNTADANETITVSAGTGGSTSGTMTVAQNNGKRFLVVFTSSTGEPAGYGTPDGYTIYSLGTYTF